MDQHFCPSRLGEPTWEIAHLHPLQGEWTEKDYLALETNRFVELTDGCLEFPTAPDIYHQLLVGYLCSALYDFVKARALGYAVPATLPVRLWPGTFREPDVIYLKHGRVKDVHSQPDGADLVMEVVNKDKEDRHRDFVTKRKEYAQAGIPEYWIIDPGERRIIVLTLDGNMYREHGSFLPGTQATSVLLAGFSVDVAAVFAAGEKFF